MAANLHVQRGSPDKSSFPKRLRRNLGTFVEDLWHKSRPFRFVRVDAILLEGKERETGKTIKVFYFGHYTNYEFIMGRFLSETRILEINRKVQSIFIGHWISRYIDRADILCLDVELLYYRLLPQHDYLCLPHWIRQKCHLHDAWEDVQSNFRKDIKRGDLRRIRKYDLSYRITSDEREFSNFYHHMYVPYLTKRHQQEVIIHPERKVMKQCRKGELIQIMREGQVVAAALLHTYNGHMTGVWVGVPEGLPNDLYAGAFGGLYYYTIQYGFEQGCREIDFLGSRPLLNDGLFRYKRKWGTSVTDSLRPKGSILLKPVKFTDPVKQIFGKNVFIVRDGHNLVGKMLIDGKQLSEKDLKSLAEKFYTNGLSSLKLFSLTKIGDNIHEYVEEIGTNVQLVDLSDLSRPQELFCQL